MAIMEVNGTLAQVLANAAIGLISDCSVGEGYVNVEYYNGFAEVIWFKSSTSPVIFSNAIKEINKARKLRLGKPNPVNISPK